MTKALVTVSGYTGPVRRAIETMCTALGATFTTFLSPEHTHLITASTAGAKYARAAEWNVHVVNVLWIEETFRSWDIVREAQGRFVIFDTGVNEGVGGVGDVQKWIDWAEMELKEEDKIPEEALADAKETDMEVDLEVDAASVNSKNTAVAEEEEVVISNHVTQMSESKVTSKRTTPRSQAPLAPIESNPHTPTPKSQISDPVASSKRKNASQPSENSRKKSKLVETRGSDIRVIFTGCRPPGSFIQVY